MKCVCADCGNEQDKMDKCEACRSVRVILQSVAEETFGSKWRNAFLALNHPDTLKQEDVPDGSILVPVEQLLLIWWLDQPTTKAVVKSDKFVLLPDYLQNQVEDRQDRSGRGRLWIDDTLPEINIDPWPETELAKRIDIGSFGGIVFKKEDYFLIANVGLGIITDTKLVEIKE